MSYLSFPRLHFSGRFQADTSTVNNDPSHFNDATFQPNDQLPGRGASNGWWNPHGTGYWRFSDCLIQSVVYQDGTTCSDPQEDPIVGIPVNDADSQVGGKLVDLDPEQQMVSEIWGFQIHLGSPNGTMVMKSLFEVAPFIDIWMRYPAGQPDSFFGAFYQSILHDIEWGKLVGSRFLKELFAANGGKLPTRLSIKFSVDGFDDDSTSASFTYGRVSGAIGLYEESEPIHFVNGRYLRTPAGDPSPVLNYAPALVDEKNGWLHLDLGNSLPTIHAGGPLADVGPLYLATSGKGGTYQILDQIIYRSRNWYENQAGIQSFKLDDPVLKQAASSPLAVVKKESDGSYTPMLSENQEAALVRADNFVFRLEAGGQAQVELYANVFGRPAAGQKIALSFNSSTMQGQQQQGANPGPPAGTPESALEFVDASGHPIKRITTDASGKASFWLQGQDPGNPRGYIDGQVYGVQYTWEGINDYNWNGSNILSVLVFDAYEVKGEPTWQDQVQPIFQQYANLYPVMKTIMDLSDYDSVVSRRQALKLVFSRPLTDPNYMPVTRDLSTPKREMLLRWLDHPLFSRMSEIETLDDLKAALQTAIELEHATIPVYLTGLYSIKPGYNQEVAAIIRSVVMEEMLHMALACNILNAIGGAPQIDKPGFVPTFPGPLPGGVRPSLTVHLRKCSIPQIRDVYMQIEEPGEIGNPAQPEMNTIGWFYRKIEEAIERLGDRIFTGKEDRQLTDWRHPGNLIKVTNVATAKAAIREIQEQGEGASPINPEDGYDELAHYYKFSEIVNGRRIELNPGGFSYTGPLIDFDPDGVYPMMDDPDIDKLSNTSRAKTMSKTFNNSYKHLLQSLHAVFNGQPDQLNKAVGLMFSLTVQAHKLMDIPIYPGEAVTAGPSFQV